MTHGSAKAKEFLPLFNPVAKARREHDIQSHAAADDMNRHDLAKKQGDFVLGLIRSHRGITTKDLDIIAEAIWPWPWKTRAASKRVGGLVSYNLVRKEKYKDGKILKFAKLWEVK